jgi:protein-L-isoaspartate O-methyltransferase
MSDKLEQQATALRKAMVERLTANGQLNMPSVKAAMLEVPRHAFAPWLSLEDVYGDGAHPTPESRPEPRHHPRSPHQQRSP